MPALLDSESFGYSTLARDVVWCVTEQEFYQGLPQRVRAIADRADPFTRRRLLDLAKRYDAKGGVSRPAATDRPLPAPRTTPPASIFSGRAGPDARSGAGHIGLAQRAQRQFGNRLLPNWSARRLLHHRHVILGELGLEAKALLSLALRCRILVPRIMTNLNRPAISICRIGVRASHGRGPTVG
ncbi:hypothetical protein BSZ21_00810 [Bradyrhizobium canariense]|nr:hypothetical protein BSZ21_00810 [Bradyrhizobium canariense]